MLLATKLVVPRVTKDLVPRPRVLGKVNVGAEMCPLTLICAPAGFGKTTVLISALEAQPLPVAWLSLDADDNDPLTLMAYLIAATQKVFPDIASDDLAQAMARKVRLPEQMLSLWINAIEKCQSPLVLALDDFHCLESPDVIQLFERLLVNQPRDLYIALTSRSRPRLSLSRLRTQRRIAELSEQDLRFTSDESKVFFKLNQIENLSETELDVLQQRTEGWVAGMQLAALSLQRESIPADFINAFSGDDRFITDYLTEEVLRLQSEDVRDFLLRTSLLARMNASLCDAILQRSDSQAMLERLERTDMFMIPLDHSRQWFRYHHLFGELLRGQLVQQAGVDVDQLHTRAALWFSAQDFPNEAMQHALAAKNFELAIDVLAQHSQRLFSLGQNRLLIGWCQQIPRHLLQRSPQLLLSYVWARFVGTGFLDGELLSMLENSIPEADAPYFKFEINIMRGFEALQLRDASTAVRLAEETLSAYTGDATYQIAGMELQLGGAYYLQDRLTEAYQAFKRSWTLSVANNIAVCVGGAVGGMASCLKRMGRFEEAEQLLMSALENSEQYEVYDQLADDAWIYLGLAHCALLRGAYSQAEAWIQQAEQHPACDFWDALVFYVPMMRARVLYEQNKTDEAQAILVSIGKVDIRQPLLPLFPAQATEYADACLQVGDITKARQYLQISGMDVDGFDIEREIARGQFNEHFALARLWIANGHSQAAQGVLIKLASMAEEDQRHGDQARVRSVLQSIDPGVESQPDILSQKEQRILKLLAQGLSNSDIAERSFVSVNTVKTHLKNIYAKLGVESRLQAVDAARRLGLESIEEH